VYRSTFGDEMKVWKLRAGDCGATRMRGQCAVVPLSRVPVSLSGRVTRVTNRVRKKTAGSCVRGSRVGKNWGGARDAPDNLN
jgi:hypothetical protein